MTMEPTAPPAISVEKLSQATPKQAIEDHLSIRASDQAIAQAEKTRSLSGSSEQAALKTRVLQKKGKQQKQLIAQKLQCLVIAVIDLAHVHVVFVVHSALVPAPERYRQILPKYHPISIP